MATAAVDSNAITDSTPTTETPVFGRLPDVSALTCRWLGLPCYDSEEQPGLPMLPFPLPTLVLPMHPAITGL